MRDKAILANSFPSFTIGKIRSYFTLTKPRLLSSVIFSAVLGYILPLNGNLGVYSLLYLILGTALLGGGANALNQWQEQVPDSKMNRTSNRPIPKGTVSSGEALVFGVTISFIGILTLWIGLNILTSIIGIVTLSLSISNPVYKLIIKKNINTNFFLDVFFRLAFLILSIVLIFFGLYLESM